MAYFQHDSEAMLDLEAMIDRVGPRNVAFAVANICGAKAEHLRSAWQDDRTAKDWDKLARAWESFASRSPGSPLDGEG